MKLFASARERTWFHRPLPLKPFSHSSASESWDAIETNALDDVESIFSRAKILEFLAPGDIPWGQSLVFSHHQGSFRITCIFWKIRKLKRPNEKKMANPSPHDCLLLHLLFLLQSSNLFRHYSSPDWSHRSHINKQINRNTKIHLKRLHISIITIDCPERANVFILHHG